MRIAYLEDELPQAEVIKDWLAAANHTCLHYPGASPFIRDARRETYDLLILDWELKESSGIDVLKWVRGNVDWHIPVLFVTNRDSEGDIVQALEAGADDYMTKPVARDVIMARIKALARRAEGGARTDNDIEQGGFRISRNEGAITLNGETIELTEKEFQLAVLLFENVGRLLSRSYMLETVWGLTSGLNTRTVDTHISRLRRKLSLLPENGWRIKAVYHHGYRLETVRAVD